MLQVRLYIGYHYLYSICCIYLSYNVSIIFGLQCYCTICKKHDWCFQTYASQPIKVWLANDIQKLEKIINTFKILVETETNTTRVEFEIVHRLHSPAGLIILQGFH